VASRATRLEPPRKFQHLRGIGGVEVEGACQNLSCPSPSAGSRLQLVPSETKSLEGHISKFEKELADARA
jgi:hypothetical protein